MNPSACIVVAMVGEKLRSIYCKPLRARGYEVGEAASGEEAMECVQRTRPQLLLLGTDLGDLSGVEICRRVKRVPEWEDVFVALLSERPTNYDARIEGLAAGADDYLTEPVIEEEFLARVESLLRLQRATAALRTSEERSGLLLEVLPDALAALDTEGRILSVNRQAVLLHGGDSAADLIGRSFFEIVSTKQQEEIRTHWGRVLEGKGVFELQCEWVRNDGQRFPIELDATSVSDRLGQIREIITLSRDITQRTQAEALLRDREERLRNQEARFRALLENAQDIVAVVDAEGLIRYVSPSVQRVLGYASAELIGQEVFGLIHPDELADAQQLLVEQRVIPGAGPLLTHRVRHLDGSWRTLEFIGMNRLDDPDVLGFVLNIRDVTQRKHVEETLRQTNQMLRAIFEAAPVAIVDLDREGHVQNFWNPAAERMLGWKREEVVGRLLPSVPAEKIEEAQANWRQVHAGEPLRGVDVHRRRKDGSPIDYSIHAAPVYNDAGEIIGNISVLVDITERKQAEQRLSEALELNRTVIATSAIGIAAYRASGECVFANQALARLVGGPLDEILKMNFRRIGAWQESGLLRLAEEALASGEPRSRELHLVSTFGKEVWLDVQLAPFVSGGEVHLLAMCNDVSERHRTAQLLQAQRDLGISLSMTSDLTIALERLLDVAMQVEGVDCGGIYLVNETTGEVHLASHRGLSAAFIEAVSHYPAEAIQARLIQEGKPLYAAQDALPHSSRSLREREGLRALAIVPLRHEGASIGSLNVASHRSEELPPQMRVVLEALAAQAGDAIARIKAEQARRESEALLRVFFDSPGIARGIVELIDHDILVLSANAALAARFQLTPDTVCQRRATALGVPREDIDYWISQYERSRQLSTPVNFEYCHRSPEGDRWSLVTASFLGTASTGHPQFAFVAQDITERKKADQALQDFPARVFEAQETERQRLARDLHDGITQLLASTKFRLHMIDEQGRRLKKEHRETLVRCRELIGQALEESRRIAHNLRPRDLDDLGLTAACRNLCSEFYSRTGICAQFDGSTLKERLRPEMELHFFRIIQEALNNVEKHSRATRVRVAVVPRGGFLELKIEDNGCGFEAGTIRPGPSGRPGLGLTNIRERVSALRGTCEIQSALERGTQILARIPLAVNR